MVKNKKVLKKFLLGKKTQPICNGKKQSFKNSPLGEKQWHKNDLCNGQKRKF